MNIININLSKGEQRKLLCISDLHLCDVDFKTIQGFKSTGESFIIDTLIPKIKENNITDIMFLGDIVDKGYRSVGAAYSHMTLLENIKESIKGVFGTILGNHFFIETQNNPELYWIQPHPLYKPIEKIYRTTQILSTPDIIRIGTTQISCFHFNRQNKKYHMDLLPGIHTHIGLYHDDCVVPNSVRMYGASNNDISLYYDNIDIAVHGHIHIPHDIIYINVGNRKVPLIIPGSCSLTSSDKREFHNSVKLPVFTITDNSCNTSFLNLSLGVGKYRIVKQNKEPQSEIKKQVAEIRKKSSLTIKVDSIANFIRSNNLPIDYIDYIKRAADHSLTVAEMLRTVRAHGTFQINVKELGIDNEDDN